MRYTVIICLLVVSALTFSFFSSDKQSESITTNKTILVKNGAGIGNDLYVPAHPRRVIFLNSSSLDLWLGAGGKDSVCAYIKFPTLPERIYGQLNKDTVILGNSPRINPEFIIQQKPDLVVTNSTSAVQTKLGDVLKQFNIPLLTIYNNSVEDTIFELELYGKLTGKPEAAAKEINRIKDNIQKIVKTYAGKQKPKAALILGTTSSFSMMLPNSRQSKFLELAGGVNIAPENSNASINYIPLSLEYLAKENPEYIFFISMGEEEKILASLQKAFSENPAWQTLQAIKDNKVHVLPTELFSSHYGLNIDKAVQHINKIIHKN